MPPPESARMRALRRVAIWAGALALTIGLVTLVVGWWFDVALVRQPFSGASAMRAATALGLAASGLGVVAIGARWPRLVAVLAGSVPALIGAVALTAYALHREKTILESAVALDLALDSRIEGRLAINTAACFVAVGAAVLLLAWHSSPGARQVLGTLTFFVAYAAMLGYATGTMAVAGDIHPGYTAMAPLTATPLLLLGFAVVVVDLRAGWASILVAPMAGGRLARLLVPSLLGLVLAVAVLYPLLREVAGTANASALALVLVSAGTLALLVLVARRLEGVDTERASLATTIEDRILAGTLDARESAELMNEQFHHAPNGVALLSPGGRVIEVNEALCALMGRDRRTIVAMGLNALMHPDDAGEQISRAEAMPGDSTTSPFRHVRYLRPDGSIVWVRQTTALVRDDAGSPAIVIHSLVDITDRLSAEQRLADTAEMLRVVLDNSTDGVVRLDRDLRIEYANSRFEEMSGVPLGECIGQTVEVAGFPPRMGGNRRLPSPLGPRGRRSHVVRVHCRRRRGAPLARRPRRPRARRDRNGHFCGDDISRHHRAQADGDGAPRPRHSRSPHAPVEPHAGHARP